MAKAFMSSMMRALMGPRDLTAYEASLTDLNNKSDTWEQKVIESDNAKAALDSAQQAFDAAVAAEGLARQELQTAQAEYKTKYDAVEKEDGSSTP